MDENVLPLSHFFAGLETDDNSWEPYSYCNCRFFEQACYRNRKQQMVMIQTIYYCRLLQVIDPVSEGAVLEKIFLFLTFTVGI